MKRALISVSDKTGITEFAAKLEKYGYEIISTGGTKKILEDAGIQTIGISQITGFPEIMGGRVKTLHPGVHGGLLCVRDNDEHMQELRDNNIALIDLVVVNLYPFEETVKKANVAHETIVENIDIGGPSMLRSAGKNYKYVTACCDFNDYPKILEEIERFGETTLSTREQLAGKVFKHTAHYDSLINNYFSSKDIAQFPEKLSLNYSKVKELRYGENPHQSAAFYKTELETYSIVNAIQMGGKELSYNNITDGNAALELLREFHNPTVVAVKHMNPCGVGQGENIFTAWTNAYEGDPVSIFGGVVATNQKIDVETAKKMNELFLEIVIAPDYNSEALNILKGKNNLRILKLNMNNREIQDKKMVSVLGGILIQDIDKEELSLSEIEFVTDRQPTTEELRNLLFAWKVVKHVKSNAIVIGKNNRTIGIGAGQMNRVGAAKIALEQSGHEAKGAVLASDAFFPMPDTVELAAKYGIKAIIQPGGSIKDKASIDRCNDFGIAMVFTGTRHFKH